MNTLEANKRAPDSDSEFQLEQPELKKVMMPSPRARKLIIQNLITTMVKLTKLNPPWTLLVTQWRMRKKE
jgi:hypothetical protein